MVSSHTLYLLISIYLTYFTYLFLFILRLFSLASNPPYLNKAGASRLPTSKVDSRSMVCFENLCSTLSIVQILTAPIDNLAVFLLPPRLEKDLVDLINSLFDFRTSLV